MNNHNDNDGLAAAAGNMIDEKCKTFGAELVAIEEKILNDTAPDEAFGDNGLASHLLSAGRSILSGIKIYSFDGTPFVEIHSPSFKTEHNEGAYTVELVIKYKKLGV